MMSLLIAYIAGVAMVLSPCILPALGLILAGSYQQKPFAPLLMAVGLAATFIIIGVVFSVFSKLLFLYQGYVSIIFGYLAILVGVVLISETLQTQLGKLFNPIMQGSNQLLTNKPFSNVAKGVLIGGLWSPCVGPILGLAMMLLSSGKSMVLSFLVIVVFTMGTITPLLLIAYGLRWLILKYTTSIVRVARVGRIIFGVFCIILGILILLEWDTIIIAKTMNWLPNWWIELIS